MTRKMHVYAHSATLLLSVPVSVYINVVLPGFVTSTSTGNCRCTKGCIGPPTYPTGPPTSFIAVTTGNFSRTTAAAECRSRGGRLAWVTASYFDLHISISSAFKRYCNNCTFLWIGMNYNTFTNDFVLWNTADNSNVTCAHGIVPSSLSGMTHAVTIEDCVGFEKLGNGTWAWKLANCADTVSVTAGTNNGYICEYKTVCSAKWPDPPSTLCRVLTTTTPVSTTTTPISTTITPISTTTTPISTTTTPTSTTTTPISTTTTPTTTTTPISTTATPVSTTTTPISTTTTPISTTATPVSSTTTPTKPISTTTTPTTPTTPISTTTTPTTPISTTTTPTTPISTTITPISTTITPTFTTSIKTPIQTSEKSKATTLDKTRRPSTSNTPLTISSTSVQATSSTAATTEPKHAVAVGVIVGASVGSLVVIALVAIVSVLIIKKRPDIAGSRKHRQIGVDESNETRNSQSTDESRKASKSQSIHIHVNA